MTTGQTFALTGANGFLGWHVRLALNSLGHSFVDIPLGANFSEKEAKAALSQADHVIHLAGVNRGTDDEVESGNVLFADQISSAMRQSAGRIQSVTYANSIQALNPGVYGDAKSRASETLGQAAGDIKADYHNRLLPNLFGEHGRPFYNSVVATFCHLLASGEGEPTVQQDKELQLLHAQDAADWLIGAIDDSGAHSVLRTANVSDLRDILKSQSETYAAGEIPDIGNPFHRDLFNTYRSFIPARGVDLVKHSDDRGSFVEMIRSNGGTGQSSFSTTLPGISRGNHYHRRKVERFVVISGRAKLQLRRMFTNDVITIQTDGQPVSLDQPTGWTHNLKNMGDDTLFMFFWTNDIFDPNNADTFLEPV